MAVKEKGISKILVANRGEIAIRIMKTARKMGISTVAVFSEVDSGEKFLSFADEAFPLGGILPRESYLEAEKIIHAAKSTGADAIHPGYGFLSEKADFASAVEKAGIVFIGPSPNSILAMGDKISSKKMAKEAGVSVVPGLADAVSDFPAVLEAVNSIGYPVMLKASAGGGGKGMRVVYEEKELKVAFENCVNEAVKNFKDGRVFVEKYIVKPRHIEVQVLGDKRGNIVCLGERECSIQRFNQKIVEEAPSPFVDPSLRERMYADAVKLCKACGYYSAGTVEFVVDSSKNFYFLEMNTRLQVEHAVTEMITGYDLVEEMIRVARGEDLRFQQKDVKLRGSAIECRICAEDPFNNFASSSGRITYYHEPKEGAEIRVESSCKKGSVVTPYYDSMIGKLISHGDDRGEAIAGMRRALSEYVISGIETNIFMLECIIRNGRFEMGDITTQFIKEEYPSGFVGMKADEKTLKFLLVTASFINHIVADVQQVSVDNVKIVLDTMNIPEDNKCCIVIDGLQYVTHIDDWIASPKGRYDIMVNINGKDRTWFTLLYNSGGKFVQVRENPGKKIKVGFEEGAFKTVKVEKLSSNRFELALDGVESVAVAYPFHIMHLLQYVSKKPAREKPKNKVFSQMSGLVTNIAVAIGQEVKKGDILMSIEAMKMENSIVATCDGVVKEIFKNKGDVVSSNQLLVEISI